jgi:hypothetical protein
LFKEEPLSAEPNPAEASAFRQRDFFAVTAFRAAPRACFHRKMTQKPVFLRLCG